MIQVKNVITGSAAMVGGVAGVMYCFIKSKNPSGPSLKSAVVFGIIGVVIGGVIGIVTGSGIKEETTDEKFT